MPDFDDDFGDFEEDGFDEDNFMDDGFYENADFDEDLEAEDGDAPDNFKEELAGDDKFNKNGFLSQDAFYLGTAMGLAYEEGRKEAERKKLRKK